MTFKKRRPVALYGSAVSGARLAEVSLKGIRQKLLLGASLALLPLTSAWADSLMDALTKAYAGNPNLAAEQANLRSIDESRPQAVAQRRPTITGQAQGGIQAQNTQEFGKQTIYPYSASIGVTQPLWTGGRADAAIEQANYQIKAERANLLNEEESILLQAATAYFDVYQQPGRPRPRHQQRQGADPGPRRGQCPIQGRACHPDRRRPGRSSAAVRLCRPAPGRGQSDQFPGGLSQCRGQLARRAEAGTAGERAARHGRGDRRPRDRAPIPRS